MTRKLQFAQSDIFSRQDKRATALVAIEKLTTEVVWRHLPCYVMDARLFSNDTLHKKNIIGTMYIETNRVYSGSIPSMGEYSEYRVFRVWGSTPSIYFYNVS